MALLDVLGFETGLVTATLTETELDAVSIGASATLQASSTIARTPLSRYSLQAATAGSSVVAYGERDWGSNQATICLELYVRFTAVPAAVTSFASLYDSTPAAICDLRVNASGNWCLYNYGDTTTYTGTGQIVVAGQWYRIELKLYAHGSAGTIDLKVNGALEPGVSGLASKNTLPGGQPRRYRVGVTVAQANAGVRYIDDVLVATDWIGMGFIKAALPASSPVTAWTIVDAGKASWATQVEVPWASATTDLIKSSTANQEEHLGITPLAFTVTGATILGVQAVIRHKRTVAGSAAAVTIYIRSNGADGTGVAIDAGGATFTTKRGFLEVVDPSGGGAWTLARIAALLIKLVHDAGTNEAQVNASLVYIAWSTTGSGFAEASSQGTKGYWARLGKLFAIADVSRYRKRGRTAHKVN